jgi:hypothetical protein
LGLQHGHQSGLLHGLQPGVLHTSASVPQVLANVPTDLFTNVPAGAGGPPGLSAGVSTNLQAGMQYSVPLDVNMLTNMPNVSNNFTNVPVSLGGMQCPPTNGPALNYTTLVQQLQGLVTTLGAVAGQANGTPVVQPTVTAPNILQTEVPGVSQKTLDAAVRGEFIDINEFVTPIMASSYLPLTDIEPYIDSNGSVCYKQKRLSRKVTNFSSWTEAWMRYQKFLVGHLGAEIHNSMVDYFVFVLESDRKYSWSAIAILDYKHRLAISKKPTLGDRLAFARVDPLVLPTVLDASSLKPNATRCRRCSGYDHVTSSCPFPEMGPTGQKTSKSEKGQEICQNWNRDKCRFGTSCSRKHACRVCQGSLPFFQCTNSGPCQGKGKVVPIT